MKALAEMTVLIIGLGQIGGSLGLDLVRRKIGGRVVGHDSDQSTLLKAKRRRAIHEAAVSLAAGLSTADLVILAMPIDSILKSLSCILPNLQENCLCIDVASTKVAILKQVDRLRACAAYASTHPVAGNEGSGFDSASRGLFDGKVWTVTPATSARSCDLKVVYELIRRLGARPVSIDAQRHDRLLARTSHLPYALAAALVHSNAKISQTDRLLWSLTGGSFRSATRVAHSSPELTCGLLQSNKAEVLKAIAEFEAQLRTLSKMLRKGGGSSLRQYVISAHRAIIKRHR